MGKGISKLFASKTPVRILMIGLDSAGKSTILYKFKLGEYVQTIPTIGFNVESVKYKNVSFECWDTGGQEKFRSLWAHYSKNAQAIIFVVDSSDIDRVKDARDELVGLLKEVDTTDVTLLVYANKQDVPDAIPVAKLKRKLGLEELEGVKWHIEGSIATTGAGLFEGLDWLVENLPDEKEMKKRAKENAKSSHEA